MWNEWISRRRMIASGAAALAAGEAVFAQPAPPGTRPAGPPEGGSRPFAPGEPDRDYTPVVVPDGTTLPWRLVDGVKVFHLVAEPVTREFAPGLVVNCWGYNGQAPGPLIEAVEGDRVRIYVTNRLPEPTTVHWHGVLLPNGMDGVGGLTQPTIKPGETFAYEFTLRQFGTFMYHPHFDEMTQMAMGMMGMFVIHPRRPIGPKVDRDFAIILNEWQIEPGTSRPSPNAMSDFNVLTFNHKAFPGTSPLVVRLGQRVRIRFGNLSAVDHHPIHLHGYAFRTTGTDGGPIRESAQWPETTVLVSVGTTRDVEFVADAPGDWAMHCHMTHHMMNQMGHGWNNLVGIDPRGLDERIKPLLPGYMTMGHDGMGGHAGHAQHMKLPPNSIPMAGANGPFEYMDTGGMFTILKVREGIANYDDPGWYRHPPGTVAGRADEASLRRDRIDVAATSAASPAREHEHH
jgi:FtsP/CotA-like multicopper oxidase with cupredoxin domain